MNASRHRRAAASCACCYKYSNTKHYCRVLGNELQQFSINSNKFNFYRLYCLEAEPTNPGLSFMQLYVYSE